jgi:hypothetical protein
MRPYDKSKEETIKAKVTEVKELVRGPMTIVALVVDVDGQDAQIALGTKEYLNEKGMAFSKGDEITIRGIKNDSVRQIGHDGPEGRRARPDQMGKGPDKGPGKDTKKTAEKPEKHKKGEAAAPKEFKVAGEARATAINANDERPVRAMRIRTREVTSGGKTLTVLDNDGRPAWRPNPPAAADRAGKPETTAAEK